MLAVALTGNEHDAWDLAQGALERVGKRWGKTRVDDPLAYTARVMVNLNVENHRRRRREVLTDEVVESAVSIADADGLNHHLLEALGALSRSQRTAVALRYLNDLSIDDIAAVMQCSTGTVRSHLSLGTRRLRESLAPVSAWKDED